MPHRVRVSALSGACSLFCESARRGKVGLSWDQRYNLDAMAEMTLIEKVLFLQNVELLSSLSPEQLGRIALITHGDKMPKGRVVFREQERSDSMYVIVRGKVALEADGEQILVVSEKEVIGTWALLDDEPMVMSATVVEDARLLRIEREDFYDLLADHSEIMQSIFRVLIRRIRKLVEK